MDKDKLSDIIDQYHKTIIIFFTLIGATFQVINLLMVSIESIKFFSITSAISDSIIMSINILIFLFFVFLYRILISLTFLDFSSILIKPKIYKSSKFFKKYNLLIFIIIYLILNYFNAYYNINNLTFRLFLISSFISIFYIIFYELLPKKIEAFNTYIYFVIITFILTIGFSFIFPKFSEIYDKEIINISKHETYLLEKYESVEIKYFNDNYMFIIVREKKSVVDKLIIEKTDKLF